MYTPIALLAASAGLASAATSYKASFTEYGSTDTWGSGNCNVATTACGFYTSVHLHPSLYHQLVLTSDPTARLLSSSLSKRIWCRRRRRRWPSLRNLLEADRLHRFQRQQEVLRRPYRRPSHKPLPCRLQPSVCTERIVWHKPIRRQPQLRLVH